MLPCRIINTAIDIYAPPHPHATNSNINTDTKNHMLKSIFVLTNVLLHIKQTGLHKNNLAILIKLLHAFISTTTPTPLDIFNTIEYIFLKMIG